MDKWTTVVIDQADEIKLVPTSGPMITVGCGRGVPDFHLHMPIEAAERLYALLGAELQDRQRRAHPETVTGEVELLQVDDPEATYTPEQIADAMWGR
jgi:hypothetical protein